MKILFCLLCVVGVTANAQTNQLYFLPDVISAGGNILHERYGAGEIELSIGPIVAQGNFRIAKETQGDFRLGADVGRMIYWAFPVAAIQPIVHGYWSPNGIGYRLGASITPFTTLWPNKAYGFNRCQLSLWHFNSQTIGQGLGIGISFNMNWSRTLAVSVAAADARMRRATDLPFYR